MNIVHLPDNSLEFIRDNNDLVELVKIHMGFEVSQVVKELADEADGRKARTESDLGVYEMSLEDNQNAFSDLSDELSSLSSELDKDRLNRKDISKIIDRMERIVFNQI